jgi:hypothetical protein
MTSRTEMMTAAYWRAAKAARHPIPELAIVAQGTLWHLTAAPAASPAVRRAAMRQLVQLGLLDINATKEG